MLLALCYFLCAASANFLAADQVTTSTCVEEEDIIMVNLSGLLIYIQNWLIDSAALQNNA